MCYIKVGHLGLHSLYNHFCVLSFHSILYFTNDWNRFDVKNINYHKVDNILSVLKILLAFVRGYLSRG